MNSSNDDARNFGSFRPHPRTPQTKQHQQQQTYHSQYPSTSEDFIPLSYSSPLPSNKQKFYKNMDNKFSPNTQNYHTSSSWHNNSRSFSKNRKFSSRDLSLNQSGSSTGGKFYQHGFRKNFNKADKNDISAYYHPSMIEDPWKDLMDRYNDFDNFTQPHNDGDNEKSNDATFTDHEQSSAKPTDVEDSETSLVT